MLAQLGTYLTLLSLARVVPEGGTISLAEDPALLQWPVPPSTPAANASAGAHHLSPVLPPHVVVLPRWEPLHHMFNPWRPASYDYHIFPRRSRPKELHFFDYGSWQEWSVLVIETLLFVIFDVIVIRRLPDTARFHVVAVLLWVGLAALCGAVVFFQRGTAQTLDWFTGYILEWVLSFENLFVFHLTFKAFKTPPSALHAAVFLGLLGAIGLRLCFFLLVSTLIHVIHWIRWPFGLLLIWSGATVAMEDEEGEEAADLTEGTVYKSLTWCFGSRLSTDYDGSRCFTWDAGGRLQMTRLVPVIVVINLVDLVFALDSVTAKVANIEDQYISFSSSVIAMFALRSMFFVIKDLTEMFALMKYGLAIILIVVGLQLMFMDYIHVRSYTVAILIVAVLTVSILASSLQQRIKEGSSAAIGG